MNARKRDEERTLHAIARFVEREVAFLHHYKAIYAALRNVLIAPDAGALRFGHFFFNAVGAWYTTSMLVTLRALTETSSRGARALSLVGLLHRIATSPTYSEAAHDQARADIETVRNEAAALYAVVSGHVVHRDNSVPSAGVDENEIYRVLDVVSTILDRALIVVLGPSYERVLVDVDPYWATNLFSFAWGKPSEHMQRLAGGRDAHVILESQRRDFTEKAVYARRPADDELALYGLTRDEFERLRDEQYPDAE